MGAHLQENPTHSPSLESVEIELAFQTEDTVTAGFEQAVRHALEKAGGALLFHMRGRASSDWVAAASVGTGPERQILLLTVSPEGELRVEPAEGSENPIARIAAPFADVMERLASA